MKRATWWRGTYILRGLKVAFESYWDEASGKCLPDVNGRVTVECTNRTAAEDVTHVEAIKEGESASSQAHIGAAEVAARK